MKGMTAFSRISDVREYLIEESLELFEGKAAAPAPKPQNAFSRFANSGWFVAAVCTLVAVCVMGGIICLLAMMHAGLPLLPRRIIFISALLSLPIPTNSVAPLYVVVTCDVLLPDFVPEIPSPKRTNPSCSSKGAV